MAFQFGGTFCAKWFLFLSYPAVTDGLLTGAGETFLNFARHQKVQDDNWVYPSRQEEEEEEQDNEL
jgi:hypothetical protein